MRVVAPVSRTRLRSIERVNNTTSREFVSSISGKGYISEGSAGLLREFALERIPQQSRPLPLNFPSF